MSHWTHIVGSLHIETYMDTHDTLQYVKSKLCNAPKITGSENNAYVFVNLPPEYTSFTSADCDRCEHRSVCNYLFPPDEFECKWGSFQTRCVITICGDLRDRLEDQTKDEFNAFVEYIKECGFGVRNIACTISDALIYEN